MRFCRFCQGAVYRPIISSIVTITVLGLAAPAKLRLITAAQADSTLPESLQTLEVIDYDKHHTGDVFRDELTGSASHIDQDSLDRSPYSLARLVAHETGVQFRQSGGFGSYSHVSIRAASAAQTGVYLDGILLNNGGNPVIDLSTLEMLNLSSVDIYRGSSPLQLGHASIGGAINLSTKTSTDQPAYRIRLDTASYSEAGLHLAHQGEYGKWSVLAAAGSRHSENDFGFTNNNGTPLNLTDDTYQRRHNAQGDKSSALIRLGYEQHEYSRTNVTLQSSNRDLGVTEWGNRENNSARYNTRSTQLHLTQTLDQLFSWNTKHSLYWHQDNTHFLDEFGQIGLGPDNMHNGTRTLGAMTYWEQLKHNGTLGMSLDIRHEELDSINQVDESESFTADRESILGSLHYTWFDTNERWTITPAARVQLIEQDGENKSEEANYRRSRTGLQLGLAYSINEAFRLTANTGSYYREASFGELFGSSGLINSNSSLQPETGSNVDFGIAYNGKLFNAKATIFASHRDELIVTSFDSQGVGRPVNSGKARVLGVELSVDVSISQHVNLQSNMTWQDPRNKERQAGFYDKLLPGEARLAWFTRLQYQKSRSVFWLETDVLNNRYYDQANLLVARNTQQHSAGFDWKNKHWQSTAAIHNLGDVNIEDFNGFPKPGRHWSLSIQRKF